MGITEADQPQPLTPGEAAKQIHQLRIDLGLIGMQLVWTQATLLGALSAARLSREDAEGLVSTVQRIAAFADQETADQPGEAKRAERALQFLDALRGALGLPE